MQARCGSSLEQGVTAEMIRRSQILSMLPKESFLLIETECGVREKEEGCLEHPSKWKNRVAVCCDWEEQAGGGGWTLGVLS